ncbi:amino acid dehydrogenase [Aneurinibacillus migulanus]|uniref:Glu/Leu/Phe/Val family dehydrogenase n=1 Tax=Aneurinibacillus migulanus TaxID=47500 RepID=UPI0005BBD639|nr:Glu/Leu/Phe/Val dehydrogenase dimerization domain-containing protein [Aneurinibacillus migulanus]KIV55987.1 amino acid dehydrogenase [Aneurinibacillus migulanus]KPD06506.1 amino acid dehydrogenase [Aneurinibacillus migulanus]MCP1356591.1 Glu/Leu/Phe/Val dehydrogenase [Aneurinibacillus migulanus]
MKNPYLVVEWNDTETNAQGWMVVHNFVKGYAGGGTRMHPTVTKEEVKRLAEAMAYKYTACESKTTGGCKAGIAYDYKAPDAKAVLRRFLIAMMPYVDAGVSLGSDLGTNYDDVLKVFKEFGIDIPLTKSMKQDQNVLQGIKAFDDLLGTKVDGLCLNDAVTGYGVAFSADEAWKFKRGKEGATVVIQGFGCVGASCALKMTHLGYKVVGIADANLLVTCEEGLDIQKLIDHKNAHGEMNPDSFESNYVTRSNTEWLDIDCDILIPSALEDVINETNAHKVKASLIVEAANIPISHAGDKIIKQRGIDIVNDFVANLGAIRFYDAVIFGLVKPESQEVIADIEKLCRKNTYNLFTEAKKRNEYQREVAYEMFKPAVSDLLEYAEPAKAISVQP